MFRISLFVLLLIGTAQGQDKPAGVTVLGPSLAPDPTALPLQVAPGRFVPISPVDGSASYIPESPAYRIYKVPPGGQYVGVKWDAAPGAEPEAYTWPQVKGPLYVILARGVPGEYPIQLLKNGPPDVGPVKNGVAILLQIGPRPPPDPTPVPPGPTPNPVNPLPSEKLRVLTVYETADTLTSAQNVVLKSVIPQQAVKAAGGDYMCLDQNNDPTKYAADQWWKDAWKRKPSSVNPPKIILSSPKGFFEGDVPTSVDAFVALLKKYS